MSTVELPARLSAAVAPAELQALVHSPADLPGHLDRLAAYVDSRGPGLLSYHPGWLAILQRGLGHTPYCLEAVAAGQTRGLLPLCYVRSLLFGRFLVGLPYVNYGGVLAEDEAAEAVLINRAVQLAADLKVRYLELRHEHLVKDPALTE